MTVSEQLEICRKSNGWSMREVARRLGCSAAFLCDVKLGRRSLSMVMALKFKSVFPDVDWVGLCMAERLKAAENKVEKIMKEMGGFRPVKFHSMKSEPLPVATQTQTKKRSKQK